jgi:hypothetical protein
LHMQWKWKDCWNHLIQAVEPYFEGNASQWLVNDLISKQKILSQIFVIICRVGVSTSTKYVMILVCINAMGSRVIPRRLEVITFV